MIGSAKRTWVVCGGGDHRQMEILRARATWPGAKFIATNAAVLEFKGGELPHFAFLSDPEACRLYGDHARTLRKCGVTRLVTLYRSDDALWARGLADFDMLVRVSRTTEADFSPGCYTGISFSGLYCLQFAINHGATRVALAGMEGYPPEHPKASAKCKIIGLFTRSMIIACPEVEFVFCSKPNYWSLIEGNDNARILNLRA